jgi:hypothetical protein
VHTTDGFATYEVQFDDEDDLYLRCIGFVDESRGWVGTSCAKHRTSGRAPGIRAGAAPST